jgi:restriction system protein
MNPLIEALVNLGGSATVAEIVTKVAEIAGLSEDQLQVPHGSSRGYSEVEYRLAWSRTYLKQFGVLENSTRGVWSLTTTGQRVGRVDPRQVVRTVRASMKKLADLGDETPDEPVEITWREKVLEVMLAMSPASFERLAQRVLRESGFIQIEVTGRSGDGGIDGKGILRLGGLLSFQVIF